MKRWAIASITFFAALLFVFVVADLWNQPGPTFGEPDSNGAPTIVVKDQTSEKSKAPADDFNPEFYDLPNFEDVDYPQAGKHLIDLHQVDGVYRESEVIARNRQNWLVFGERNNHYLLEYSKAKVKRLSTTSYTGEENDVRLTFDTEAKPILAFRNFEPLRPSTITTIYLRPTTEEIDMRNLPIGAMEDGYSRDFNLHDSWYTLRVSKGIQKDGTKVGVLVLEHDDQKQVVDFTQYFEGEPVIIGDLLWVGDLDNDRKLDLYINRYNEKGGFGGFLFLSSEADAGKMVKLSATWGLAGC